MTDSLKDYYDKISTNMLIAIVRLKTAIRTLPDSAEGVTKLSNNCCTVSFSQLSVGKYGHTMLNPSYWLTRETKDQLIKMVDTSKDIGKDIKEILEKGHLKDYTKIPPNVLAALKTAWEG
jgi:hypothetical protein